MDTFLWIIQIILGIKLITVTITHGLRQSHSTMQEAIQKMGRVAPPLLTLIAAGAFLGTLGIVLPGILGSMRWLTPATAAVMVIMLLCSTIFHIKYRDKPKIFVSIVLALFAACITYGRWKLLP